MAADIPTNSTGRIKENLHQIRENNHILELRSEPDQVERVLVDRDFLGESGGIVTAQPRPTVRVHADTKVADASLQVSVSSNVFNGGVHIVVDLGRVRVGCVRLVVK